MREKTRLFEAVTVPTPSVLLSLSLTSEHPTVLEATETIDNNPLCKLRPQCSNRLVQYHTHWLVQPGLEPRTLAASHMCSFHCTMLSLQCHDFSSFLTETQHSL